MASLGLHNWAGNLQYSATKLHEPCSVEEVQEIVRRSAFLRVVGSRHCFNAIADAEELMSLANLKGVVSMDAAAGQVTIWGGTTYGELCPVLESHGLAIHNLASLPHISVAGAVATASHGSGQCNGNLATAVVGMQLVAGQGKVVELHEDTDARALRDAVVGLGCLGVVTQLTLRVEPSFNVRQRVFDGLFLSMLSQERLDSVLGASYSVSLFTSWRPVSTQSDDVEFRVWLKQREVDGEGLGQHGWPTIEQLSEGVDAPLSGCIECSTKQFPLKGMDPTNCTDQSCTGPWYDRLPHFRLEFEPAFGEELQSEYFIPRAWAAESLRAVQEVAPTITPFLLCSEIRSVSADGLLMSPHGERQVGPNGSVAIHFSWRKQEAEIMTQVLPVLEQALEPFEARPHWGKLFATPRERLELLYNGALGEFRSIMQRYDPEAQFRNPWVEATITGVAPCGSRGSGAERPHGCTKAAAAAEMKGVRAGSPRAAGA